ncbi:hypothetical protein IAR55_006707 [Kwoniella newhampshirensis]|uniref:NmrA-like domain-containing protein n=1 Tax=Kwoniella newhampshirensis TaxID=1651941 RepID=A0AAW0YTP0_9TREE
MVNTVGLIGHNGTLGKSVLVELAKLHAQGKINLSVIHRPTSNTATIPSDVERRELDYDAEDGPSFDAAVKGVNILLSTVGGLGSESQVKLYPALSRSKDLVTFIPSEFGPHYTAYDKAHATIGILQPKITALEEAQKMQLPVTVVQAGITASLVFRAASHDYLAKATASLVTTQDATSLADKHFHVYELNPTGADIAKAFTEGIGSETKLVPLTDDELDAKLHSTNGFEALGATIFRKRADDDLQYQGDRVQVAGYQSQGLNAIVKAAL